VADLLLVADGAYPHPPYDFLPAHIAVWAGYLGGHTPHDWTVAEIAALEATGRTWWGIWTAPDRQAIGAGQGAADAADTIARLGALRYPKTKPVFYDVEYGTWHADPAGAEAAASRWKHDVAAAGWRRAYWYGPLASHCDWVANWTGVRPASLPPGRIGVQYDHALSNDRYDISVFDPSLLEATVSAPLSDADVVKIVTGLRPDLIRLAQYVAGRENAVFNPQSVVDVSTPGDTIATLEAALTTLTRDVAALGRQLSAVAGLSGAFTITGSGTVGPTP